MADSNNNGSGGLLGIDPELVMNLGLGLMSAARYGGNLGSALSDSYQNYQMGKLRQQQIGTNQLQYQMLKARMPALQAFYGAVPSMFPGGGTQGGVMPSGNPSSGPPQPDSSTVISGSGQPSTEQTVQGVASNMAPSAAAPGMPTAPAPSPISRAGAAPPVGAGGLLGADPYRMLDVGTMGVLAGAPEGEALINAAKTRLQFDPNVATRMEAAKSAVAQDQQMIQQALAQGNEPLARAIYNGKFQEDLGLLKVSSMGGIQTRIDPITGRIDTFNPSTGIQSQGGVASLIPGMAGALQQKSGAEALGQAQGELVPMIDPKTHQTVYVPKSALLGGPRPPTPGSPAPGAAPAGASAFAQPGGAAPAASGPGGGAPIAALSPGQRGFLEERGRESAQYVGKLQDAADSATNTNYALDQMTAAARNVQLGPGAPARQWIENAATGLGQQFGIAPPTELANYEQLDKYANQIAFAATRQMGSREAAQIVHLQMQSNPNKQLVPEAFTGLVQSIKAMNNYVIAKNTAIQGQSGADNDSALQAASVWTQRIDPRVWDLSLGPELAAKFAGTIGIAKIATAIPVMASEDGIAVIRNLPLQLRAPVLARLPAAVKQEILAGMQQSGGATGAW